MAKKINSASTLSSFWCPPTELPSNGVGEPVACVATTFEFDAGFFETELLPRFLGLKFDHSENETTFLVEREEKLRETDTAVLVDIHKVDPGQTTLRWDQIPIAVPGARAIQHAKIVLLAWERLIRLIVGSANLTPKGYRRNREVFAALDFWDDPESVPRAPLSDAIALLERMLFWSRVPAGTRQRAMDSLAEARARLAKWTKAPADFRPRQKPRLSFVATCPPSGGIGANSTIDQVMAEWGPRSLTEVAVCTPFVGEPSEGGDKVVERLASLRCSRECIGWLILPRYPSGESDETVRVPFPRSFGEAWKKMFNSRGGGRVIALPLHVNGVDKVNRALHSKVLSLEDEARHLLMIGSSNFTPHGMGVDVFNVEANLLFEDAGGEMWRGIKMPVAWEDWISAEDVEWNEDYMPAEDTIDKACLLPKFFAWASYSQVSGILRVQLDRAQPQPSAWSVRLKGAEGDELKLFDGRTTDSGDELSFTFPENQRAAALSCLLVDWTDSEGQMRQARLIVSITSKDDLARTELFKGFGVDAMIECLIRGQSLAEWQEWQQDRKGFGPSINATLDSLRSIDTSEYMLYRVRLFGRALTGLCERLEKTALLPTAMRYRFFKDPLGPLAVAEALTTSLSPRTGSLVTLTQEHRLFLLAELLLVLAHATSRLQKQCDTAVKKWLAPLTHEAVANLAQRISDLRHGIGPQLPVNMDTYIRQVLDQAAALLGPLYVSKELADAR
jgi:hypothetical protein